MLDIRKFCCVFFAIDPEPMIGKKRIEAWDGEESRGQGWERRGRRKLKGGQVRTSLALKYDVKYSGPCPPQCYRVYLTPRCRAFKRHKIFVRKVLSSLREESFSEIFRWAVGFKRSMFPFSHCHLSFESRLIQTCSSSGSFFDLFAGTAEKETILEKKRRSVIGIGEIEKEWSSRNGAFRLTANSKPLPTIDNELA